MQCEKCGESGTVRITEIVAGKPVDRFFCKPHAREELGVRRSEEWEALGDWIAAYFKQHGTLPTAAEIAPHGQAGRSMAQFVEHCPEDSRQFMRDRLRDRLAI